MNVVMCSTRNWYWYLAVSIYALLKHNNINKIYLFIEDDEISYIKDKRVKFINTNNIPEYIKHNSPNYNSKYTKMSFIRCYLSKILQEDKILYIDTDAIVVDNIEKLWNIDLQDYAVAGVKEPGQWSKHLNRENIDNKYINSGVLLMNLELIRKEKLDDKMIKLLNSKFFWFPDQDIINIVCEDRIKYISNIYNSTETTGIVENAKVIHYIRKRKGWIKGSPRSEIWFKYYNEMIEKGGIDMIKCEVIEMCTLKRFNELNNLVRNNPNKNQDGWLYVSDTFECTEDLAKYLLNEKGYENPKNKPFVKKIEVIPEKKKEEVKEEVVQEEVKTRKKRSKKTIAKE